MRMHAIRPLGRHIFLACLMLAAVGVQQHALASAPSPIGKWARADGGSKIDLTQCGQEYCAVNIWVRNPNGREKVGDKLEMALVPEANPAILKGRAYDVRRDMHYEMTMTLMGDQMHTQGCILFGILCKSADWNRID